MKLVTIGALVLAWLSGFALAANLFRPNVTSQARMFNIVICLIAFSGALYLAMQ